MKTRIVVDSSSNLYELPGAEFACVPLKIVTDDQEYLDDGHLDAVGMAQTLRDYKGKTTTSCPNVADWLAAYEGAEQVFAVTITGLPAGSVVAGMMKLANPFIPLGGSHFSVMENSSTIIVASQKFGKDSPTSETMRIS